MPSSSCCKKKVTGRYQLQFPVKWVREQLSGRTAEEWREIIMAAWETSSPAMQHQWRHSFQSTVDNLMRTTLTVKNRTGRRFDRDAYAREAHFVYGPAVSPADASPKLLARCFKHSVDFVVHHGLSNSSMADLSANTGEHTVPSGSDSLDIARENSFDPHQSVESQCDNDVSGSSNVPKVSFRFGLGPIPGADMFDVEMREDDDQYTRLLDEMLKCSEEELFSCDEDLQLDLDPEHMCDLHFSDDSCPSTPRQTGSEPQDVVWRSSSGSQAGSHSVGWHSQMWSEDCVEQQLFRAREDLAAARQQRDDAVRLCQQLQVQLAAVLEQREQSPGTDVPEDGCFR